MKLCTLAALVADSISSLVASSLPYLILLMIVVSNKTGSCDTTPMVLRKLERLRSFIK